MASSMMNVVIYKYTIYKQECYVDQKQEDLH